MKKFSLSLVLITGLIFAGYAVFWHMAAKTINDEIASLFLEADKNAVTIDGARPSVSGFPRKHRIFFSGFIHNGYATLAIPALEIKGFPMPGQEIDVLLPQGLSLSSDASPMDGDAIDSDIWSLSHLALAGPVPTNAPRARTVESLSRWRDGGGKITISSFALKKESLEASGNGEISLDNDLQPSGNLHLFVKGHQPFLGWLQEKNLIEPKQALITAAVLNALAKDSGSGEREIEATLTLQNRNVLLGPLRIATIPETAWPYEERKALHFE